MAQSTDQAVIACEPLMFTFIQARVVLILTHAAISKEISMTFPKTAQRLAELYLRHEVKGLLIGWHPSTVQDAFRNSNEHVIELATTYPDAFPGVLASLDVGSSDLQAVAQYGEALLGHPKVLGFKFHPPDQGFYPSDKRFYD